MSIKQQLGEAQIFTPHWVTNEMLDFFDQDCFCDERTYFFEPSCGNGEMLVVMISRIYNKLLEKYDGQKEKAFADALFKFYAIDLDEEMVVQCRMKIFHFFVDLLSEWESVDYPMLCHYMISRNIADKIEHRDFFELMGKHDRQIERDEKEKRKGRKKKKKVKDSG